MNQTFWSILTGKSLTFFLQNSRLLKTITYKIVSFFLSAVITYLFIGRISIAVMVAVADLVATTLWYYGHDFVWELLEKRLVLKKAQRTLAARYEEWLRLNK